MGDWYSIGILVGLGAAIGIASTAALRRALAGLVVAVAVSVIIGFAFGQWDEAAGGFVGALCGSLGIEPVVAGTLRRGGTRGGTATLLALGALVGAALAFVPVVGYLEAVAVPALGLRLRRRAPETHAGLRTLARD
jgi:large-conductance mechanosensitive channel